MWTTHIRNFECDVCHCTFSPWSTLSEIIMSFQKRQAYYTKVLGTNKGKQNSPAVQNYYQTEPIRPTSPNFGSIQWPETPTPPHLRLYQQPEVCFESD